MNILQFLLPDTIIYALGWTVLHSVWQGAVLAVILYSILYFFKDRSAQWKYVLANAFLLAALLLAAVTFLWLYEKSGPGAIQRLHPMIPAYPSLEWAVEEPAARYSGFQPLVTYLHEHIALITTFWMIGLFVFGLRLAGGLFYVQHIKRCAALPGVDHWQHMLDDLRAGLKLSFPVALLESRKILVPMTVGFIKPVILFPIGMLNRLPVEQVEAILAHELAHIYRYDYLINILQSLIETVLYFNPAVWWMSAIIRRERENICDDLAINLCGSSLTYARALVSLQEQNAGLPTLAMGLSNNKQALLNRIRRILKQPQQNSTIMEKLIASCLLLFFVLLFSFGAGRPEEVVDSPETKRAAVEEFSLTAVLPQSDTLLPKGKMTLEMTKKDTTVKVQIENGKINYLMINGKEIAESDFPKYESYVEALIRDIPEPPAPPAPPRPGLIAPPAPPAPPAPEAPSNVLRRKGVKVETERDEQGNIRIFMDEGGFNKPVEVRLEGDDQIIINGDTIRPGESVVISNDDLFFTPHPFAVRPGKNGFQSFHFGDRGDFAPEFRFWGLKNGNTLRFDSLGLQGMEFNMFFPKDSIPEKYKEMMEEVRKKKDSIRLQQQELFERQRKQEKEMREKRGQLERQLFQNQEKIEEERLKGYREMEKVRQEILKAQEKLEKELFRYRSEQNKKFMQRDTL